MEWVGRVRPRARSEPAGAVPSYHSVA